MEAVQPVRWKMNGDDPGRLGRLAYFTARHRWAVIGVWVVLTLIGGVAAGKLSSRWYQSFSIPGKSAYEASQRTLKTFGVGVRPPNVVVFHTAGDATKSAAIQDAMRQRGGAIVTESCNPYHRVWELLGDPEASRARVTVESR